MVFARKASPHSLEGKHALVTGGAQGIGFEVCRALIGRRAASVSVLDVSDSALQLAAETLRAEAGDTVISVFTVDVTSEAQVIAATSDAAKQHGRLDVVFANAGIGPGGGILERDAQFFEKLMAVNYMGVVHTLKAALPIMVEQKAGSCIVTNSTAGFAGCPGLSAYSASKFAVRGLVESVRLEMLGSGINFHVACPSFVDTNMLQDSRKGTTPELRKLFDETATLMHPSTVAHYIVDGVEKGAYILRSPNFGVDFIISGCLVPRSPRPYNLFLDMMLAPLYVLGHWYTTRTLDNMTQKLLQSSGETQAPSSTLARIYRAVEMAACQKPLLLLSAVAGAGAAAVAAGVAAM